MKILIVKTSSLGDIIQTFAVAEYLKKRYPDAVIDWVEKQKAPNSIVANRVVNSKVVRTRPLCPYPQVARYSGQGSIDEATSFRCMAP